VKGQGVGSEKKGRREKTAADSARFGIWKKGGKRRSDEKAAREIKRQHLGPSTEGEKI